MPGWIESNGQRFVVPHNLVACEASRPMVTRTLNAPVDPFHGRSPFLWLRLPNGSTVLAVVPYGGLWSEVRGDTYPMETVPEPSDDDYAVTYLSDVGVVTTQSFIANGRTNLSGIAAGSIAPDLPLVTARRLLRSFRDFDRHDELDPGLVIAYNDQVDEFNEHAINRVPHHVVIYVDDDLAGGWACSPTDTGTVYRFDTDHICAVATPTGDLVYVETALSSDGCALFPGTPVRSGDRCGVVAEINPDVRSQITVRWNSTSESPTYVIQRLNAYNVRHGWDFT